MCVVPSLLLVLSFFHKNFSLICINHLKICQIVLAASFFSFTFKLFEDRVVQGSLVFVNEEVTVHLHIIDAKLFFFAGNKNTL